MKIKCVLALIFALPALTVSASEFYGVGNLGQSRFELDSVDGSFRETDAVFVIGVGYKFNEIFAAEAGYADFGEVRKHIMYEDADERYDASAKAFQIALLTFLSLGDATSIYGRLGVANIKWDSSYEIESWGDPVISGSDSGTEMKALYGVGLQYALTQSVVLRVEYNQIGDIDNMKISFTALGITCRF